MTFAKSGGAGTVSGLTTDVAVAGVAQITVTGALVGTIDLEATGATFTSNTLTFDVVVGAALDRLAHFPHDLPDGEDLLHPRGRGRHEVQAAGQRADAGQERHPQL